MSSIFAKPRLPQAESFFTPNTLTTDDEITQLAREDPLGTKMWRMYARNAAQLPNADRMANLSWRMMSMGLQKLHTEQQT